jgi:hypothetical protein
MGCEKKDCKKAAYLHSQVHYKWQQIEFNCKYGVDLSEDQILHQPSLFVYFSEFCLLLLSNQKLQKYLHAKKWIFQGDDF